MYTIENNTRHIDIKQKHFKDYVYITVYRRGIIDPEAGFRINKKDNTVVFDDRDRIFIRNLGVNKDIVFGSLCVEDIYLLHFIIEFDTEKIVLN